MNPEEMPLRNLFNRLRQQHSLPLGVDEYMVVLRSLQAGFGIGSRQELEQLCCTLWTKSDEEARLLHRLFEQMWALRVPRSGDFASSASLPPSPTKSNAPLPETPLPEASPSVASSADLKTPPGLTLEMDEPVQVVQAVRRSGRNLELRRPRYSLLTEYFPVTRRQMKQSWRQLRRLVREGSPEELDVAATVEKMGREGILLEPVLVPRRSNRTDLVMLIDQQGSMVPFHDLSRCLVETAQRGGRLKQTSVYYFHDYPDNYLYRHPAQLDAQPIDDVLETIDERAVVLIVSDAGAARGNFDQERVNRTQDFIEQLKQSVRYCAWLNPMPNDCWLHTTAGEIARFVPMFEMSRQGLNAAISVLRGRYVSIEKMYPWMV